MLHVLWIILKILLIIILSLFLLVLTGILLLLFAPITYRVDAKLENTTEVRAGIRFLILSLKLEYNREGGLKKIIRIAGIRLGRKKTDELTADAVHASEDEIDDISSYEDSDNEADDLYDMETDEKPFNDTFEAAEDAGKHIGAKTAPEDEEPDIEYDLWEEKNKTDCEGVVTRIRKLFMRLADFMRRTSAFLGENTPDKLAEKISAKSDDISRKLDRIRRFWNMECTVRTRAYLKKYIAGIIKHIMPRKIKGYVHYGLDEPYKTGKVTGYLSLIPFVYQKDFSLHPDFYNKVMEGHIYMRGHMQLGYLLRIALNINIWRTIKVVKRLMNKA